jgi:hypothetical protein
MNGWLIFALSAVGFLALGFLLDRIIVRVIMWREDKILEKIISDQIVALFFEERDERNGRSGKV